MKLKSDLSLAKILAARLTLLSIATILPGCQPKSDSAAAAASSRYLYVASGACYSGPNTTFSNTTASNQVFRINLDTGNRDVILADYFRSPSSPGDSPVGLADIDGGNLYVLVENTTTPSLRRIEKVGKLNQAPRSNFSNNLTVLSSQVRNMMGLSSGDLLISKSSALEYLTASNSRFGAPFISPTAGACATSTTLITKSLTLGNGNVVFLHAAAGQNRFGIYNTAGGTTCLTAQAAPNAASYPTAAFYDSVNLKLIVAYSGSATTTDLNSIYAYTINETTGAISSPQKIYDSSLYPGTYPYLLYGISEMAYDSINGIVYIATATTTATTIVNYSIEKFQYLPANIGTSNASVLKRAGTSSFYPYGNDTKCISQMMLGY